MSYSNPKVICFFMLLMAHLGLHYTAAHNDDDVDALFLKVEDINRQMSGWNTRLDTEVNFAKATLRSELKRHIKKKVGEILVEMLNSESLEEVIRSQVLTEVRQLRHSQHQLRRRVQQLSKSFDDVALEKETCRQTLAKAEQNASDFLSYFKHLIESRCDAESSMIQSKVDTIEMQLKRATEEIQVLKDDLETLNNSCQIQEDNETFTTSEPVTTSAPSVKTEPQRKRIIVAPHEKTFSQLNIHSNTLSNYNHQKFQKVDSLAYVPSLNKLLASTHDPGKIVSYTLDSYGAIVLREGVISNGMAVDDERGLVFLTTYSPKKSISRISTVGKGWTIISNLNKYSSPRSITIDPRKQRIYAVVYTHLITVMYNGSHLQELATGSNMYAVTLDISGDLYYNNKKNLMKMATSSENYTSSHVTSLPVSPWNIVYYKDVVYFSNVNSGSNSDIGRVDLFNDVTVTPLKTIPGDQFCICLVP